MVLKKIRNVFLMAAGVLLCSFSLGMKAEASEVLKTAGVATMLRQNLTEEQYVAVAKEIDEVTSGYENLGLANVPENRLNIRKFPDTGAEVVGQMPHMSAAEVLNVANGWAHITSGEVEGYVSLEYLLTGPDAIVAAKKLAQPFEVALTATEAKYGRGVSDVRTSLAEYAQKFVGNPYKWGGISLTKGADCSGFVLSVFKEFGIDLPHHSGGQAKYGESVKVDELLPGDLIFYANSKGTINHVAIYIGDGKVVHASNERTGITISKYNYRTPYKYKSLL